MRHSALILLWLAAAVVCADTSEIAGEFMPPRGQYLFPDESALIDLTDWKVAVGDSSCWADSSFNDSAWTASSGTGMWVLSGLPSTGIVWYRTRLFLPQSIDSIDQLVLYLVSTVTASELYWDGIAVGRNGIVGHDRNSEEPGFSGQLYVLPAVLTEPGPHTLAIRVSNFHAYSGIVEPAASIGYFSKVRSHLFLHGMALAFLAGIFLITAVFHIALLVGDRDRWPYAVFSAFCLSCAGHIFIENLLRFWGVNLKWFYLLAMVNDIPWMLMMILLPVFFLFEFSFPRKRTATVIISVVAAFVVLLPRLSAFGVIPMQWLGGLDTFSRVHAYATILFSCVVTGWAMVQRKVGCLTSAAGLVAFLGGVIITDRIGLDYGWAVGFAVLIIFLTASLSNQMRQRSKAHQSMQLRSARLELELLKKHIQPHFLLNSLNSIVAWLEEDPATAAHLVNALADEFRRLLRSARETRITLSEEVRLCRSHLQVMGLRYGKQYELRTEGVRYDEFVPPFILHTLVENGLSHGYAGKDKGLFVLRQEDLPAIRRLILFNDSDVEDTALAVEEGTGVLYVKGRLEEMYPGKWAFRSHAVHGGWQVEIDVARDAL